MTDSKHILAFAVLLTVFMLWPLRNGELWIIDDHQIVAQSHKYHALKPASFFLRYKTLLLKTEVGRPDRASRYRPVYYAVRTLKSGLMGNNAKTWFLLNAAYCLVGIIAIGLALGRFFHWYVTLPFMALVMALPLHSDLWARLGPSEIDAFTYFMFFCLAASHFPEKALWAWPCCNIAVALAIGSKENFLLLFLPLGMLAIYGLMQKTLQPWRLWWLVLPASVAYPVVRVVMRTVESGRNIYFQDMTTQSLLDKATLFFRSPGFFICVACLAALLILYIIARNQSRSAVVEKFLPVPLELQNIYCSLAVFFALAMLVAGNFIFYSGSPTPNSRYAFPYYFLLPALVLCPLYPLMANVISGYTSSQTFKSIITILGIVAIATTMPSIYENRLQVKQQIQRTVDFQNALKEARRYQKIFLINPGQSHVSHEPYVSLKKYEEAGYLPPVWYFPLFGQQESEFDIARGNTLRSVVSKQPPLTIASDVLLWGPPFLADLKKVEHTRDSRDIKELLAVPDLYYSSDGLAHIASSAIFYIPMDDPAITGMTLNGSGENNPAAWRISVNDHIIAEENISYSKNSFTFKLPVMKPDDFPHPQLYKLSFEPIDANSQTLRLRSLILLR